MSEERFEVQDSAGDEAKFAALLAGVEEKVEAAPKPEEKKEAAPEKVEKKESAPEPSEVETRARAHKWMPKEEWVAAGRNPDDWVSAKRFTEEYQRIQEIRELRDWRQNQDGVTRRLVEKVQGDERRRYDAELSAIREKRKEAIAAGDAEAYDHWDAKLEEAKETRPVEPPKPKVAPEVEGLRNQVRAIHSDLDAVTGTEKFGVFIRNHPAFDVWDNALSKNPAFYADIVTAFKQGEAKPNGEQKEERRIADSPVGAPRRQEMRKKGPEHTVWSDLSSEAKYTHLELERLGMAKKEDRDGYAKECARRGEA